MEHSHLGEEISESARERRRVGAQQLSVGTLQREHAHAPCGLRLAQRGGKLAHARLRHHDVCGRGEAERWHWRLMLRLPLEELACGDAEPGQLTGGGRACMLLPNVPRRNVTSAQ